MSSGALLKMQRAITTYINKKISNATNNTGKTNAAVQGKFSNGKVLIGNVNYNADLAVDIPVKNGDTVWCVIDDSNSTAVIVGM